MRYIAIDVNFPHHVNAFDNVPVNYSAGPLVNITMMSSIPTYYQNTINYTAQTTLADLFYTTFSLPLTNNVDSHKK